MSVGGVIFWSIVSKIRENRETPFSPLAPMRLVLPTSGHDLPCAVPKFTAIRAVTANPHTQYTEQTGLPYFERAALAANGNW